MVWVFILSCEKTVTLDSSEEAIQIDHRYAFEAAELDPPFHHVNSIWAGVALLDMMFRTANGRLTAAEVLGHRQFVLTRLYESA